MQKLAKEILGPRKNEEASDLNVDNTLISFLAEVPPSIKGAMETFIDAHPNWDQYRLIQAALSGFLIQNGVHSRSINRLYFQNMFSKKGFGKSLGV